MNTHEWVAVRRHPQDASSIWIRIDTIERVELRSTGGRAPDWCIFASVRSDSFALAETPMAKEEARERARELMAAVALERSQSGGQADRCP